MQSRPNERKTSNTPNPKSVFSRILIAAIIFAAAAFFLLIALLPSLASSHWGKEKITSIVNAQIPGRISIEQLSLSWLGPQEIQGFLLRDPKGAVILNMKKGTASASIFGLFFHNIASGEIDIDSLSGLIEADASGKTNLEKSLDKDCCKRSQEDPLLAAAAAFHIANAKANFDARHQKPLTLHMHGETYQENIKGKFSVDAKLTGTDFEHLVHADRDFLRSSPEAEFQIQADISNLPVALLDQFLALKRPELAGILKEMIGQQLNLNLNQTTSQHEAIFVFNAQSSQLKATLEAGVSNNFYTRKPGTISLKITPALIEKLAAANRISTAWQLLNPSTLEIVIDSLQFPISQLEKSLDEFDLTQVGLIAKLSLQEVSAKGGASLGTIDVQKLVVALETQAGSTAGNVTLTGDAAHNGAPFKINLAAALTKTPRWGDFVKSWRQHIRIDGGIKEIPVASFDAHLGMDGRLLQFLGDRAEIAVSLQMLQKAPLATVAFKSDNIEIPSLSFWLGEDIVLKNPIEATLQLSPALMSEVLSTHANSLTFLQHPPSASIKINKFSMPFPLGFDTSQALTLQAEASLSPLTFSQIPGFGELSLHDIVLNINGKSLTDMTCSAMCRFSQTAAQGLLREATGGVHGSFDPVARSIKINFDGSTLLGDNRDAGQFSGEAVMENWLGKDSNIDLKQAVLHFNAKSHKLPTSVLDALNKEAGLAALIGDSIDANIAGDLAFASSQGVLTLDLHSSLFEGSASLKLDHGISLHHNATPASFALLLTPEGYAALRNSINGQTTDNLVLTGPARINMELTKLDVPWEALSPIRLPYWKAAVDMNISIDKLEAIDTTTQHKVILNGMNARLTSQDISRHTAFEMRSSGQTSYGVMTALAVVGALEKGFSPDGSVNERDLSLTLDASVENLPVPLICEMACLNPEMTQKANAIIGSALNAKIKARLQEMSGPVYVELNGINGHTILDGQLAKGALTLNKDFYAELKVTPQLGKYVLQDLIPFLSGVIESDQPLKLTISRDGFLLPLHQFAHTDISIAGASLEMGKMRFSNQGQLAKVLSLLTTAEANEIAVWLTPAYFSFSDGLFKLQRVDMLISDRYPIAAWGKVDIPHDSVNMVIGLSGAAIGKAFGVSSSLRKNYMLQLPFKGSISNASIDKGKAVGRLSALVAQSQGGPHGLVIGTVLDIATGGLTEERPPEPTTNPLPWDAMMEESSSDTDSTDQPKATPDKTDKIIPIEEIGKGAGKLLKKLFKQ